MHQWFAKYILSFVAVIHNYIQFYQLGSIFEQIKLFNNLLILSFLFLSQITLVTSKLLTLKWICDSKFVIKVSEKEKKY